MSGYQPWIGTPGTPVEPTDFHSMSDGEADAFLRELIRRIPERVAMLEAFIRETPGFADWKADGSEESFRRLGPWVKQVIRIRPTTHEDPSTLRILNPRIPDEVIKVMQRESARLPWGYDDPILAASVGADIGVYIAHRLGIANPQLKWKRNRALRHVFHNHPVLTNRLLFFYPIAHGSAGYNLLEGSYKENRWWELFCSSLDMCLP